MDDKAQGRILYHYCSNSTFLNILTKQQLWMTDISRSNDYAEMELFLPGIYYAIEEEYLKSESSAFQYKGKNGTEALHLFIADVKRAVNIGRNSGNLTSYVLCFTQEKDLLSQWRGYADNGKGCAIGLSLNELKAYCEKTNGLMTIQKVNYIDKEDVDEYLDSAAEYFVSILINNLQNEAESFIKAHDFPTAEMDNAKLMFFMEEFKTFLFNSLCYKWDSFREENEWRLFFRNITKNDRTLFLEETNSIEWSIQGDKDFSILHGRINFYAKDDCLIPYYPLLLNEISDKPVKEIRLGPKNKTYIQDVVMLCAKNNINRPQIDYSRISYR